MLWKGLVQAALDEPALPTTPAITVALKPAPTTTTSMMLVSAGIGHPERRAMSLAHAFRLTALPATDIAMRIFHR
jgi:hypothetical protein